MADAAQSLSDAEVAPDADLLASTGIHGTYAEHIRAAFLQLLTIPSPVVVARTVQLFLL